MEFTTITKYSNCDISNGNNVEKNGFEPTKTLGEMIDLAVANQCKVIVKNGLTGRWYLKGKNNDIETLKERINENIGKHRNGVVLFLLE